MILLATAGSLGDLHPYLAVGVGLKKRGHPVAIATCEHYRSRVEGLGLGFRPVGPHISPEDPDVIRMVIDQKNGTENIFRKLVMPHIRENHADTVRALEGASLVVGHPLTLCVPIVAEQKGLPWASAVLSPLSFLSIHDPIEISGHPIVSAMTRGPAWLRGLVRSLGRAQTRRWIRPFLDFRRELGITSDAHPLFEGQHSPHLVLALYSELLADPKPDWPKRTKVTGFCFHDRKHPNQGLSPGLATFLEEGPPPIVFTLGSTAVRNPGTFYQQSAAAAKALGKRAVLLGDAAPAPDVWVEPYAPYSLLFPRCEAIVCSGGIGTIGQALRSGTPFLIVPHGNDQPDNAVRCSRLGVCRSLSRGEYRSGLVAETLAELLADVESRTKARECARIVGQEDGVAAACDALEKLL
jgi:UDP:flavonoid glycosyltransferase YjiC (YdhE family)